MRLSRFCKVNYYKTDTNRGVAECLRKGVEWCSYEIIARMDSDDIMLFNRIITQYKFMMENPTIPMCGTGIRVFKNLSTKGVWQGAESIFTTNFEGDKVAGEV